MSHGAMVGWTPRVAANSLLFDAEAQGFDEESDMSIVMGLDQHRAQITAEWVDTVTGEVSRGRIAPADRSGVRRFLERFAGQELEVALEATTGWRFVVEASPSAPGTPARWSMSTRVLAGTRSVRRATGRTLAICGSC